MVAAGVLVWQPWRPAPVALPTSCPSLVGLPDSLGTSSGLDEDGVRVEVQCAWGHGTVPPFRVRYRVERGPDREPETTSSGDLTVVVARRANVAVWAQYSATAERSPAQPDLPAWTRTLLDHLPAS
ncbi:hypothetical protein BBK82_46815 [Lentzea guizhouensis]|uniref:Uncharacterized protein n=1 Tax=Lentzea guizhouensis TaxID=1586287 RepID=A0A1B2HXA1_9PSEU|nr:hypothetical protein BBK82_46815 [Lentzea guizhouensis]